VTGAPANDSPSTVPVTRELVVAFLAKKATYTRVLQVAKARADRGEQRVVVEDIAHDALTRGLTTEALPKTVEGMWGWIAQVSVNQVTDHYREEAKHLRWLNREADVDELPGGPPMDDEAEVPADDPTAPPRPVRKVNEEALRSYLRKNAKSAADQLTLEMLETRAARKLTNERLAAEFGMSEGAYDKRLQRFNAKWVPRWRRSEDRKERTVTVVVIVAIVISVVAAIVMALRGATAERIGPAVEPTLAPAPSASAAPVEAPFNQSVPTQPSATPRLGPK
jgi:DNA-directed RNA polymerase specialized sigma24 family protein